MPGVGSVGAGPWTLLPVQTLPSHSASVPPEVSSLKANRFISFLLKVALVGLGKGLQVEGLSPRKRATALVSTPSSQWQEGLYVPPGKEWRIWESYTLCPTSATHL